MKPKESRWTDEQWRAIYERSKNLLVSAAAGSGKTAVLVERVIQTLLDEEEPLDVDRLLILTFTKAAAGEMKERIRHAIEEELKKRPASHHLRRQLLLLPGAAISTFHSFCMDLVKRYAYRLQMDPNFRILDEAEERLLRQEVLENLLEEAYGEDSFFAVADWFSSDRSDEPLQDLILRLYEFSRSRPWPEEALRKMVRLYREALEMEFDDWPWIREVKGEIGRRIEVLKAFHGKALHLCRLPGGPVEYSGRLEEEGEALNKILVTEETPWEAIEAGLRNLAFGRLPAVKRSENENRNEGLREEVKELRDRVKEEVKSLLDTYFSGSVEGRKEELQRILPVADELIHRVLLFHERYAEVKRKKGVADFSDLEHKALALLRDSRSTPGNEMPSEIARELSREYAEILIDEYQDTNEVQEAILTLLTTEGEGRRFMVGDLKQSIYRFRQTEPLLFQEKYERYSPEGNEWGTRIDLSRNFRSRREILEGVNRLFRALMRRETAGIDYDERVELKYGAGPDVEENPPSREGEEGTKSIELLIIDREKGAKELSREEENGEDHLSTAAAGEEEEANGEDEPEKESLEITAEEMERAELEARLIAFRIRDLVGSDGTSPYFLYDRKEKRMKPVRFRDIVILLRSARGWAPLFEEQFRLLGLPVYVERGGGYFSATEIQVMLSLLQLIDNPYQDIPLASVLRSPIVGLSAEELALLRLERKKGFFYDAVIRFISSKGENGQSIEHQELKATLRRFLEKMGKWRDLARRGALSRLIWQIYRETGYYDFVGGLPGGKERQANLQALYDRARLFEEGAFRGLFRFLRFVERMKERGDDMGTARALGEQEDVVRIMTIHKSKGLEFPIVFLAGASKTFNEQDLRSPTLFSKELGIGTDVVDFDLSIRSASLPKLAIREREKKEMLAEEMRLLYVALTRAKEKLYIVATLPDYKKEEERWKEKGGKGDEPLPAYHLLSAKSYLDWIGPALILPQGSSQDLSSNGASPCFQEGFTLQVIPARELSHPTRKKGEEIRSEIWETLRRFETVPASLIHEVEEEIGRQAMADEELERILGWTSPYTPMERHPAKQSVSEIKRKIQLFQEEEEEQEMLWLGSGIDSGIGIASDAAVSLRPASSSFPLRRPRLARRPRFMEEGGLTATEKGTAMHTVMQHLDLTRPLDRDRVEEELKSFVQRELLTPEQVKSIDIDGILRFFNTRMGRRMLTASHVYREVPFTFKIPASRAYPDWEGEDEEILVQGIVDALIEEEGHLLLLDYKTDRTDGIEDGELIRRYRLQVALYREAVRSIWKRPVARSFLYFFHGEKLLEVE